MSSTELSTTPEPVDLQPVTVRVTHPFHPRFGQDLEFVKRRRNWRLDRVYFFDEAGALSSLPAEWTDVVVCDGFIAEAGGRAPFRTACLLDLADRLAYLRTMGPGSGDGVKETSP